MRDKMTKFERENPETGRFIWDFSMLKEMLSNPVYVGAIASQKQVYRFKTGWVRDKKPDEWNVVEDMHEAIISREKFDLVQEKIQSRRRRAIQLVGYYSGDALRILWAHTAHGAYR